MESSFQPQWNVNLMKNMNDDELLKHYRAIKENLNLVDPLYLTEICERKLLHKITN